MLRVSQNFLRILRQFRTNFKFVFREIFVKLREDFVKREIDNFVKFSRKHENKIFRSHPIWIPIKLFQIRNTAGTGDHSNVVSAAVATTHVKSMSILQVSK